MEFGPFCAYVLLDFLCQTLLMIPGITGEARIRVVGLERMDRVAFLIVVFF